MSKICKSVDLKRDAYYKYVKRHGSRKSVGARVIKMVNKERDIQPRIGPRKFHKILADKLCSSELKVGRDRLFSIMRAGNMLVRRKKVSYKTTNS